MTTLLDEQIDALAEAQAEIDEQAAADRQTKADVARKEYFAILHRRHQPRHDDAQAIIAAMATAGISRGEYDENVRILDKADELAGKIVGADRPAEIEKLDGDLELEGRRQIAGAIGDFFGRLPVEVSVSTLDDVAKLLHRMPGGYAEIFSTLRDAALSRAANSIGRKAQFQEEARPLATGDGRTGGPPQIDPQTIRVGRMKLVEW